MSNYSRMSLCWLAPALFLVGVAAPASAADEWGYSPGVCPLVLPLSLHLQWMPYVAYLSRATDLGLRLELFENSPGFGRGFSVQDPSAGGPLRGGFCKGSPGDGRDRH